MSRAGVPADAAPSAERPAGHKYNKACDSCHVSKVRCIPEPLSPVGACKRCAKNGNPCVYTPVGPRRRPTRTKNERIAELERRVRDMQLMLRNKDEQQTPAPPATASTESTPRTCYTEIADVVASPMSRSAPATVDGSNPSSPSIPSHDVSDGPEEPPQPDVVDRGIITLEQSEDLLRDYRSDMEFEFLGICLPKDISSAELRKKKPLLWLSALCASSSGSLTHYELAGRLHIEMNRIIQERLTPDAKPSLEILQALRNFVFHHHEPTYPNQRHFLEHSRVAVRMVVSKGQSSKAHMLEGPDIPEDLIDQDTLELSRELLIWYWSSFVITMKVRQPLMLRYNRLVRQSMRIVEKSPEHADRCLAAWVKLAHLAQDAATTLFRAHTSYYGLTDEGRDVITEEFEERMREWMVNCPIDIMNAQLMIEYHSYIILISEVMFPAGKLTHKDFENRPSSLPPLTKGEANLHHYYLLAPWKLGYTRKCLTAAHSMLDLFTNMTPERLRRLGNVVYGRVFYALRFLFQLAHQVWATSSYNIIEIDSLRLQLYIDALVGCLRRASGEGKFKVAAIWLYALESRVIPWYKEFCKKLNEDHHQTPQAPNPSPRPSQDDLRPIPAEIMLPPIQPFCGDSTNKSVPVTPNMILQTPPPNCTMGQLDSPLRTETTPSMGLFNDQFFSPSFHHGQVPLDTFDPDAFSPTDLNGLSQYGQPGQFVVDDSMDIDAYGVDFQAMYELVANNMVNGWNVGDHPGGPQDPLL